MAIYTNNIYEETLNTGVTIDGVLLQDNAITAPGDIRSTGGDVCVGYDGGFIGCCSISCVYVGGSGSYCDAGIEMVDGAYATGGVVGVGECCVACFSCMCICGGLVTCIT